MANYISQVTLPNGTSYNVRELFPHVGNCTDAAATAAKTVTIGNFKLYTGAWVVVKFSNTNSAAVASLTLNVDGTGAKPIKYRNANLSSAGLLIANRYTYFIYDGTNYQIVGDFDTNSDTKVTSSANHYTPATASGQDKTASASGATAAWSIDVVKGVTLNTDGKGHVTGLSVTSGKIPANPVPSNNVTGSGTSGYLVKWNGTNTITNGPQLGSSTTTYLRNDGTWATPTNTNTTYTLGTSGNNVTLTPSSGNVQSITVPYASNAASANKLNTNAGSTNRPVYFSGGVPVQCDTPASGSWFKGVPLITTDGVMEIGKYIDFHNTNGSNADYDYRMEITTTTMTLHATGSSNILTIKSPDYTQLCFQTTSSGKAYTAPGIICYPLTTSGMTTLFNFGGNLVIGGGESAKTLYDNNYDTIKTAENEDLYLCADNDIHIVTGCQTYDDKSIIEIDAVGKVYLPTTGGIIVKQRSDSNYVSAVTWWKGGTAPGSGEYAPQIGQHNTGGDPSYPGSICILPYKSTTNPWGGNVGLFIRKDHVYIDGVELSKSTHTHKYAGSTTAGGPANSANVLNKNTRMDYGWDGVNYFNINGTAGNAAKVNDTPTTAWWHIMRFNHYNSSGYYTDLAIPFNATSLYYKRITSGSVQNGGWVKVLDALNVGYVMSSVIKYDSHARRFTSSKTDSAWNAQAYSNTGYADNVYVSFRAGQTTMYAMIGLDANPSEDANYDKIDYCWYIQNNGALKVYESGTAVTITGHTTYASGDEFRVEYSCGEIRYYHNGTMCRSVTRAVSGKLFFDSSFHNAGNVYDFSYGTSTHSTHTAEIITSTYKSTSFVTSLTSSVITLSDAASSFGGWICGPTKNGRIVISSYQGSDDKLYFGYGERGRTTNSYVKAMTWDGPTNTLTADKFVGDLQGNATRADYVNVVAGNEIRFYNDNQLKANNQFWIGYSWAQGSHYTPSGGSDTSSTTAPNITKFIMGNCSAGGLASVHAKTFILGNGSSPTHNSKTTTIATAATTTDRTITLPDASGTIAVFPAARTSGQVVVTDGTAGGIKSSGYTIATSVPSGAVFTDSKVTQTAVGSTYTNYRPIVISSANSATKGFSPSTTTDGTFITSSLYCQPSSGMLHANIFEAGKPKTTDGAAKGQLKFFSGNTSDATGTVTLECVNDAARTGDYTVKLPTWNGTIPVFEKLFDGALSTVSLSYSDINEYDLFLITVANNNGTSEQVTVASLWISNVVGVHDMPLIWGGTPSSSGGACNVTSGWIQLSKNSGTTTFSVAHKSNVAQMTSSGWSISSPTYNLYIRKIFGLKTYKRT